MAAITSALKEVFQRLGKKANVKGVFVKPMLRGKGVKEDEIKWADLDVDDKVTYSKDDLLKLESERKDVHSVEEFSGNPFGGGAQYSNISIHPEAQSHTYKEKVYKFRQKQEGQPEPNVKEDVINQAHKLISTGDGGDLATAEGLLEDTFNEVTAGSIRYALESGQSASKLIDQLVANEPSRYNAPHFSGEDDYLMHARSFDDTFDGTPTRVLQEIQSDLHQKGRRFGYRSENSVATTETITQDQFDALQSLDTMFNHADMGDDSVLDEMMETANAAGFNPAVEDDVEDWLMTMNNRIDNGQLIVQPAPVVEDLDQLASEFLEYTENAMSIPADTGDAGDVLLELRRMRDHGHSDIAELDNMTAQEINQHIQYLENYGVRWDAAQAGEENILQQIVDDFEPSNYGKPPVSPYEKTWARKTIEKELVEALNNGREQLAIPISGKEVDDNLARSPGVKTWYEKVVVPQMRKIARATGSDFELREVQSNVNTTLFRTQEQFVNWSRKILNLADTYGPETKIFKRQVADIMLHKQFRKSEIATKILKQFQAGTINADETVILLHQVKQQATTKYAIIKPKLKFEPTDPNDTNSMVLGTLTDNINFKLYSTPAASAIAAYQAGKEAKAQMEAAGKDPQFIQETLKKAKGIEELLEQGVSMDDIKKYLEANNA